MNCLHCGQAVKNSEADGLITCANCSCVMQHDVNGLKIVNKPDNDQRYRQPMFLSARQNVLPDRPTEKSAEDEGDDGAAIFTLLFVLGGGWLIGYMLIDTSWGDVLAADNKTDYLINLGLYIVLPLTILVGLADKGEFGVGVFLGGLLSAGIYLGFALPKDQVVERLGQEVSRLRFEQYVESLRPLAKEFRSCLAPIAERMEGPFSKRLEAMKQSPSFQRVSDAGAEFQIFKHLTASTMIGSNVEVVIRPMESCSYHIKTSDSVKRLAWKYILIDEIFSDFANVQPLENDGLIKAQTDSNVLKEISVTDQWLGWEVQYAIMPSGEVLSTLQASNNQP